MALNVKTFDPGNGIAISHYTERTCQLPENVNHGSNSLGAGSTLELMKSLIEGNPELARSLKRLHRYKIISCLNRFQYTA